MWNVVNKIRRKANKHSHTTKSSYNFYADSLNNYFASMSTTTTYDEPLLKSTVISYQHHLNSRTIYHLLTKNCPAGTGSDGLPQWYLQLIAPAISTPLSIIFNNCINQSYFPSQWKSSIIHPIPKTKHPTSPNEFRPISVTPILSRLLEKFIVKQHICSCFNHPSVSPNLTDQFAFCPTGSPTSAIIYLT